MKWIWLAAILAFGAAEAATLSLVSVWFAVGGIAALLAEIFGANLTVQLVVFGVVSAISLAIALPLVKRAAERNHKVPTNLDRVLGKTAKVTEDIDNEAATGAVYVDGKTWTARSVLGEALPAGTRVKIQRIEGVKLYVQKYEEKAEVLT